MNILVTGGCGFIGSNFIRYWNSNFRKDKINKKTKYVIQTGAIIFMLSMICLKGLFLLLKRNIKDILIFLDD